VINGRIVLLGVGLLSGCIGDPNRPVVMDRVGEEDLCLCTTADPPRANREECAAELARRNLTCDPAYWADFWTRRTKTGAGRDL
jgi:DNA-binding transcriptional LysR family regulator